jgi:photosystem II stability/assembly factor-like uncharacterized protein
VRKISFALIFLFFCFFSNAQWRPLALNYRYLQQPDFYIPLALDFSDTSNGFLLNNGALLQYKNQQWLPVNIGDNTDFTYSNIFTVNPRNTFLCSVDGKIAKFDGEELTVLHTVEQTETTNPTLNTIFMTDSAHGWAAGEGGTIIKIDGDNFTKDSISILYSFRDIFFDSPEHGWMIGTTQVDNGTAGVLCEYADGQWAFNSYLDELLYDIEMTSPVTGFITGKHDIYRFNENSQEWLPQEVPGYNPQFHLSLLNDNYGISVSDSGRNFIFSNNTWFPAPAAPAGDLISVKTIDNGKAWAISQAGTNNPNALNEGKIQQMLDNQWLSFSLAYLDTIKTFPVEYTITSLAAGGKKNLWVNGQHLGIPENKNWFDTVPSLASDSFINASRMFSANFGLGTNGDLLEWNGTYWMNKHIDGSNTDTSYTNITMHVFDDTTAFVCRQRLVWATNEITTELSLYNHRSNLIESSTQLDSRYPFSIHFSDRQNGWCVGDSGLMAHYSNGNWQVLPAFTEHRLASVFTIDAATAWCVGEEGELYRYDGNGWNEVHLNTEQNLYSIFFTSPTSGWITGDSGIIFKYNGIEWTRDTSNTTRGLYSIYMVDSTYGYIGGDNGTFLQYIQPGTNITSLIKRSCENNNTYFYYNLSGDNILFQWQEDRGSGFENLSEGDYYQGVETNKLTVASTPLSFNGYKYRCVANKQGNVFISDVEELKLGNEWMGTADKAWENPANWSCGIVPGENDAVVINNGEIVINSNVILKSLLIKPGVHITLAENATLTILQ